MGRSQLGATLRGALAGLLIAYGLMALSNSNIPSFLSNEERFLEEVPEHEEAAASEEEEEEEVSRTLLEACIVCIIALLIAITILFEEVKEKVEETASRNMKPIIKALFGEMTILGFLSACTFIITKTPFPNQLSERLFGEEELLVEVFEMVHFAIFFIMICFVAQVILLVRESMKSEADWEEMDRQCHRHPPSDADSKELKVFRALAKEFVLERSVKEPFELTEEEYRVPADFQFGRYLSICLGSNMAHVVHVNILSWGFFILLTFAFYELMLLLHNDLVIISWVWVGVGWIVLLLTQIFQRYIRNITQAFATPQSHVAGDSMAPLEEQNLLSDEVLPAWCKVDLEEHLKKRSWLVKKVSPLTPNRQDVLFMFEAYGPHFHFLLLQVLFVFNGVYLALFLITFAPEVWKEHNETLPIFCVYIVMSVTPMAVIHFNSHELLAATSLVGCFGTHSRRPNVIADVLREAKTAQIVRAFLVLDKMNTIVGLDEEHSPVDHQRSGRVLDAVEMAEVAKTFDAFDHSCDGHLSTDELERLMYNMGNPLTPEKLGKMLSVLDSNQDGVVSKQEFLTWYESRVCGQHDHLTMKERAHALFHLFDRNGNGKISVGEFKTMLDHFAIGFTVDEIGQLVRELDEDGNMLIGEEEFEELLEKYYPKELEGREEH